MIRLSVNLNKIALIRNARGGNFPDLIKVAQDCERFGAQGITVHPRPDERHVRFDDLAPLKEVVKTEFNVEGYPSDKFMQHVCSVKPDQCTLVPDPPGVLTSNTGWDTLAHKSFLAEVIDELHLHGIRASIFLNPEVPQVQGAKETGADRIELYTGLYAEQFETDPTGAVTLHVESSVEAKALGIGLNAGHDLNLHNLKYYADQVMGLQEVSIGHALTVDALYFGLENAIQMYLYRLA